MGGIDNDGHLHTIQTPITTIKIIKMSKHELSTRSSLSFDIEAPSN
jgi:hypothetical protein